METAKKFLQMVLETIVDDPSAIAIEAKKDEMGVFLSVRVAPEDMGKVIGKQGKTVEAIRELLRIVGFKAHAKVAFKLEEPPGRERPQRPSADQEYENIKREL